MATNFLLTESAPYFCHAISPKRHEISIVALEVEHEVACNLSNGTVFNKAKNLCTVSFSVNKISSYSSNQGDS